MGLDKVVGSAAEAVADIGDGASLAVGGFGLCGIPSVLIRGAARAGRDGPAGRVATTAASTSWGLGVLLSAQADRADDVVLRRGEQGVRAAVPARRARGGADPAGHAGRAAARRRRRHPRVLHARPASAPRSPRAGCRGATTPDGAVALASPAKETREFDGRDVRARGGITHRLRAGAGRGRRPARQPRLPTRPRRNFNPLVAMAGRVTIAEVEELVEPGELDPRPVHTPGHLRAAGRRADARAGGDKRIERRTVRAQEA